MQLVFVLIAYGVVASFLLRLELLLLEVPNLDLFSGDLGHIGTRMP